MCVMQLMVQCHTFTVNYVQIHLASKVIMDVPCPSHLQLSLLSLAYWFSRLSSQESSLSPSALLSLTGLKARPLCCSLPVFPHIHTVKHH